MSYSLHSLKQIIQGLVSGTTIGLLKRNTRSLDNGSSRKFDLGISWFNHQTKQKTQVLMCLNFFLGIPRLAYRIPRFIVPLK